MQRFLVALAVALTLFLASTQIAVARGLVSGVANDGVPTGGVVSLKPYYEAESRERFYNLNLTVAHNTLWDHLSYVSATEFEWHPGEGQFGATYVSTEQGIESKWRSFSVGAGVATVYFPATKQQTHQLFGTFAAKLWD